MANIILITMYSMLHDGIQCQDLGTNHSDEREKEKVARRAGRRMEKVGQTVAQEVAQRTFSEQSLS